MHRLANPTLAYAWGSPDAIPELLGSPPTGAPVAELWLGAHPSAPSRVLVADGPGDGEPLDAVVRRDPAGTLGANVSARFGPVLPYLLKVLAAERPLSLQVHPSIAQATAGYDAEESAGIPLTAPDRSYRDRNHKPEMLLALTPFDALCGFRLPLEAAELLEGLAATLTRDLAAILRSLPPEEAIEAAVRRLLEDGSRPTPGEVATVVDACRARLELGSPHPGADRTVLRLAEAYPGDPGVVTSLLLNQFTLEPGQAVFVPAGTVHAYQHGFAVELMSGSDNVLRAGLTSKHMDIPELLATIVYVGGPPVRVTPEQVSPVTQVFHAPVDDFVLSVTRLPDGAEHRLPGRGPRILLCLDGHATLRTAGGTLELARGGSAFVAASEGPVSLSGPGTVVQADVP